ncbi:MAG TPA: hypothetical protein VEI97_19265, partial [bacterium]|nr:hypothetical protein [bacterium]
RRTAVTNQDQEDWVRVTLNAGTRYRIDLTNSNGTYASWTYALKLVTAGGGVAQSRTDITGTTAFMEIQPDTTQTYHLQISAVPTSRRGNSVYYAEYTLSMTAVPVPEITAVTPTGLIGALDQRVTFKATATGSPTAWQWTFSGGVDPLTSTAAQPTVLLVTPGTYSGTVTATTSAGTSAPFAFQYTVPTTIVPFRTTNVHGGVVGQPAVGFDNSIVLLPPYYFAIAYRESPDNRLFVAVSQSFDPFATSADWTIHTVDTAAVRDPSMVMHNGRLAIAYYDGANSALKVARATVDEPDAATDWVIHTVESADTVGGDPSLLSGGGFLGVAYERVAGTDFGIRYARATVITPSSAGDWVTMRVTPATADYEEPGVVWQNNRPVIAYRKFEEDAEGLFVAQTPTGTPSATTDWSSHLVEGGDTGHALSLIELNGRVAMSYLNNPSKAVRVARALTVSPASTSDWVRTNVHNGGVNTMSLGTSLALVDGRMALTYASPYGLTLRLRVARALVPEPTQTSQWLLATADPATFTGGYSSLTSYNGRLAIAHSRSFQDGGHSMRFSYAQEPF